MSAVDTTARSSLPVLGEVLDFMRLIWRVDHALHRTSKRMAATLGVTGPQRLVLRIVGMLPGIPAGHLARLLHVHPSTLTGVLKRLERRGLVRRRSDARDGRRFLLGLTRRGRRFVVESEGTVEAAVQHVVRRTPAAELESARAVLASVAEALGNLHRSGENGEARRVSPSGRAGLRRSRPGFRPAPRGRARSAAAS